MSLKNEEVQSNGWTKYQQLVLNELERHEEKLNMLQSEIITLRLSHTRLEMELKNISTHLDKLLLEVASVDTKLTTKISTLNTERENLSSDLKVIKLKIAGFAAGMSLVFTVLAQIAVKFFLHS